MPRYFDQVRGLLGCHFLFHVKSCLTPPYCSPPVQWQWVPLNCPHSLKPPELWQVRWRLCPSKVPQTYYSNKAPGTASQLLFLSLLHQNTATFSPLRFSATYSTCHRSAGASARARCRNHTFWPRSGTVRSSLFFFHVKSCRSPPFCSPPVQWQWVPLNCPHSLKPPELWQVRWRLCPSKVPQTYYSNKAPGTASQPLLLSLLHQNTATFSPLRFSATYPTCHRSAGTFARARCRNHTFRPRPGDSLVASLFSKNFCTTTLQRCVPIVFQQRTPLATGPLAPLPVQGAATIFNFALGLGPGSLVLPLRLTSFPWPRQP